MIGDSTLVPPASGSPDLAALATFALDPAGRLDSWNQSAERLFGHPAADVLGRHVCDVLLTGPGHRDLVSRALAEVAAGQVWTGQAAGDGAGPALLIRCEPLPGPAPGVLVIAQPSPAQSRAIQTRTAEPAAGRDLLAEAAARIGSTLDLSRTADEAVAVAVPAFADGAVIHLAERLLADEFSGLADRAASCLDNARRYGQQRRTSLALQRGLLPARPQVPPGLEVAHWYRPVGANMVGGDWYDIVPLPGGRAVLIVGDVMGHGPEAAAVMVQLRTAAHTLADLDLPPAAVLRRLDRLAAGLPGGPFATCVYAVLDPAESCCLIAEAGHLPPLLTRGDGRTDVLDLPPGLPLGLGGEAFQPTQVSLPPDATLALYTDGLVESRTRPLGDGITALADALSMTLAPARPALDTACAAVTSRLLEHGEDDITLVLARLSPA